MIPLQSFSSGVLAEIVRRQPASKERTTFAWQLAVGPALARATTVELTDGVLMVTSARIRAGCRRSSAPAHRSWRGCSSCSADAGAKRSRLADSVRPAAELTRPRHPTERPDPTTLEATSHRHADRESVIVSAVRTPTGKFLGALKDFTAPAARRAGRARGGRAAPASIPAIVDECIMGNVVQAGQRAEPGAAGRAQRRPGRSRRRADHQQGLRLRAEGGDARGAGHRHRRHRRRGRRRHGVDEQRARTCCRACAKGCAWATARVVDSMINDGLWCAFEHCHMGNAGEVVAETYHVGRARSRTRTPPRAIARPRTPRARAGSRTRSCRSAIPQKKGAPIVVDRDEPIREDTTAEALAALKPAFKKDGTRHRRQRARRQRRRRRAGRDGRRRGARARPRRRWRASSARRRAASRRRWC